MRSYYGEGLQGGGDKAYTKQRTSDVATISYPVGSCPYQGPSCVLARAKGSKEDGTNLTLGISQPSPATVTHPPWIVVFPLCLLHLLRPSALRPSGSRRFADSATEPPRACAPWRRSLCGAVGL